MLSGLYFQFFNVDADFRRAHLNDLLKDYFDVFEKYLKDAKIEMTFEQVGDCGLTKLGRYKNFLNDSDTIQN